MGAQFDQDQGQMLKTGRPRTVDICDTFRQLYLEEKPRLSRPVFAAEQNDSGLGDEMHQSMSPLDEMNRNKGDTRQRSHSLFQALPEQIWHLLYWRDEDGDTLLHISILCGKESIIFDIIQRAPDFTYVSIANDLYQTALHLAVLTRQRRVVRRLMCAGAVTDAQDRFGNTPLHIACAHGFYEIVQELLRPVEYGETLANNYTIPYQRIPQNMNTRNFDGFICLHLAIVNGHVDVFRLILDAEIMDINCGHGKSGRTALHLASEMGNLEMLDLLLQKGDIILDATDFDGLTPFQLALGRGNERVQKLLLLRGATFRTLNCEEESDDVDLRRF